MRRCAMTPSATAGSIVVVEECLVGPEVSFFVLCDGARGLPIGIAQDHKRAFDDDEGPNTGGMGALAPSPLVDDALVEQVMRTVVDPVLVGMRAEGTPFAGILYCGLMLTDDGPKVIEFNVRFGDPEAQVVLPLLPVDLAPLLWAAAAGQLPPDHLPRPVGTRVGVVLASGGYPGAMTTGHADYRHRCGGGSGWRGWSSTRARLRKAAGSATRSSRPGGGPDRRRGGRDADGRARPRLCRSRPYLVRRHALPEGHRSALRCESPISESQNFRISLPPPTVEVLRRQ